MPNRMHNAGNWVEALQRAMEGKQTEIWTALPAQVESFDASKRTIVAQPTIQLQVEDQYGNTQWRSMPLFHDVVVQFPGGGGFVLTFPLQQGDEGILVFSSRCIDAWWERGGIQVQSELRMHDLSDGFFIPTVRSMPNVESDISTTEAQWRSVDPGGPRIALKPDGSVSVSSPLSAALGAPAISLAGADSVDVAAPAVSLNAADEVTMSAPALTMAGLLAINGIGFMEHTHFYPDGTTGGVSGGGGGGGSSTGGGGDVVGPSGAVNNHVAFFDGVTGKLLKDSGLTLSGTNTGDQSTITGNAGTATKLAAARNLDGVAFDGSADVAIIAPATHAATSKATPVDADELSLVDSAAAFVLKKLTWANIKATLKTYFDTLYAPASSSGEVILANVTLGSAGTALSSGTFAAYKFLRVRIWVPGLAASDTPSMQFNTDTGNNYRYHYLTNAPAASTWASGTNTLVSTDRVKLDAADSARCIWGEFEIANDPGLFEKVIRFEVVRGTNSIATQAVRKVGNGAWGSAAATQITRIDIVSTSNMNAGTQLIVYGQN